jgi:hypothetical protein
MAVDEKGIIIRFPIRLVTLLVYIYIYTIKMTILI